MRHIILILCLMPISALAQVSFETFEMLYFEKANKTFNISCAGESGKVKNVYIDAFTFDKTYDKTILIIEAKKLNSFIDYLSFLNDKYNEWSKTAIEINVTDLEKDFNVNLKDRYAAVFGYDEWYYDGVVRLKATFRITEGKHLILLSTGELTSSRNEYIDNDGLYLVFQDSDEVNSFISKLNVEKMINSIQEKDSKSNLFN